MSTIVDMRFRCPQQWTSEPPMNGEMERYHCICIPNAVTKIAINE